MTHGQLWPAHPKPLQDELLSSWIVRVAEANAIKVQTMSRMLFGEHRTPWNRDIDRFAPKWLLKEICQHTGVNYWIAYQTTLSTYRNLLYSRRRLSGQLRWILPNLTHGTSHLGFSMQFCPDCLAEDAIPYFRKHWRLALSTYCPTHHSMLYDACPECDLPVSFFRKDFGRELRDARDIGYCHFCGFDLRLSNRMAPDITDYDVGEKFSQIMNCLLNTRPVSYSSWHGFFAVLHHLCRVMCMRQNAGCLQEYVNEKIGRGIVIRITSGSIERLRTAERHQLLEKAVWLLVAPELRLDAAWRSKAVRYNTLIKDFSDRPQWYTAVVQRFSNGRRVRNTPRSLDT